MAASSRGWRHRHIEINSSWLISLSSFTYTRETAAKARASTAKSQSKAAANGKDDDAALRRYTHIQHLVELHDHFGVEFERRALAPAAPACSTFLTVQDMFMTPLHRQHASHTLASRAHGPQPHMRS